MKRIYQSQGKKRSKDRKSLNLEPRQTFLIVCEGERTEPNYFKGFQAPADVKIHIYGEGFNSLSLVKRAIKLASDHHYDQVWCVFDRDDVPKQIFNSAISLAKQKKFHVAYSNEAFELWYVLHFNYLHTGITRSDYINQLTKRLDHPYIKNDKNMYRDLLHRQPTAIKNARKLLAIHTKDNPEANNPSTTIHLLVEELNKFTISAMFNSGKL